MNVNNTFDTHTKKRQFNYARTLSPVIIFILPKQLMRIRVDSSNITFVKAIDKFTPHSFFDSLLDPQFKFLGGFVRKCECNDLFGIRPIRKQIRYPLRHHFFFPEPAEAIICKGLPRCFTAFLASPSSFGIEFMVCLNRQLMTSLA